MQDNNFGCDGSLEKKYRVSELIEQGVLVIGDGYRAKNSELSQTGIPFARAGNINDGFSFDRADYFPLENLHKVGEKVSQVGDVVFTSKGTVGRFAYVTEKVPKFVYSPQLCFWRSKNQNVIQSRYLYYWMQSKEFLQQMNAVKSQTDMADYVSLSDQRKMYITVPSLTKQRAISHVLGSLDDKIELNRRMNETLEQMAMALYKHWFVDFGPFQDGEFVESEVGMIPVNWELRSLYSLANFINGMAFKQKDLNDQKEGLPVIKISELNADSPKSAKYYAGPYHDKYFLNTGDVLFSWSASLDIYLWSHGPALLNQHIFNVKSNGAFNEKTLYFILKSVIDEFKNIAASRATTMGHIKKEHLEAKLIPYPPEGHREEIESKLANYFDLILSYLIEINALKETRDYLLPRLLSGEIEVREAEEQVEEVLANV